MSSTYAVCNSCKRINRVPLDSGKAPICGACKSELALHGAIFDGGDSTLPTLIKKSPIPVIVDVWAPWCGPCRMFAPTFEEFSGKYAGRVVFVKLNSDENQMSSSALGIRGIPTVLVFKNGNEVARQSGVIPREQFGAWLDQYL